MTPEEKLSSARGKLSGTAGRTALATVLLIAGFGVALPDTAGGDDFQRGVMLAERARQEKSRENRDELLGKAKSAFYAVLELDPKGKLANDTRAKLSNVLMVQAALRMEAHSGAPSEEQRNEARELYDEAYRLFERRKSSLAEQLMQFGRAADADEEELKQLNQLRSEYVQSLLMMAVIVEKSADTYEAGSEEQMQTLHKAILEYEQIYDKYRSRLVSLYARLWQSRCLRKRGEFEQALINLQELCIQPADAPPLAIFRTKVLSLTIDCLVDESQKSYEKAIELGDEWMARSGGKLQESADWLEFGFHLARAHRLNADEVDDAEVRKAHLAIARDLAQFVARRTGDFRVKAKLLLAELPNSEQAESMPAPTSFEEARLLGRDAVAEMQAIQQALANQDPAAEGGRANALKKRSDEKRVEAKRFFELALELASDDTPATDRDNVAYFLCFVYYDGDEFAKAAKLGEEVAQGEGTGAVPAATAKIALASYMRLYQAAKLEEDGRQQIAAKVHPLVDLILKRWPDAPVAQDALGSIVPMLAGQNRPVDALAYLEKMPRESSRRAQAALAVGSVFWTVFRSRHQELQQWERNGNAPPDVDLKAEQERIRRWPNQAADILTDAIDRTDCEDGVSEYLAHAALLLAEARMWLKQSEACVAALKDERVGPLQLVERKHPTAVSPGYLRDTYKLAAQAYGALSKDREARRYRRLMKKIDEARGGNPGEIDGPLNLDATEAEVDGVTEVDEARPQDD